MRVFILEDDPIRMRILREFFFNHEVDHALSCAEVAKFNPPYDLILLDHDLGGRQLDTHEDNGLAFVRLIKDRISPETIVIIHSYNPIGAKAMYEELDGDGASYWIVLAPFLGNDFRKILGKLVEDGIWNLD